MEKLLEMIKKNKLVILVSVIIFLLGCYCFISQIPTLPQNFSNNIYKMFFPRIKHSIIQIQNGKILIAGAEGFASRYIECFDTNINKALFKVKTKYKYIEPSMFQLNDENILIIDNFHGEIFNTNTKELTDANISIKEEMQKYDSNINFPTQKIQILYIKAGVLLVNIYTKVLLYDIHTKTFSSIPAIENLRLHNISVANIHNGEVLVIGNNEENKVVCGTIDLYKNIFKSLRIPSDINSRVHKVITNKDIYFITSNIVYIFNLKNQSSKKINLQQNGKIYLIDFTLHEDCLIMIVLDDKKYKFYKINNDTVIKFLESSFYPEGGKLYLTPRSELYILGGNRMPNKFAIGENYLNSDILPSQMIYSVNIKTKGTEE